MGIGDDAADVIEVVRGNFLPHLSDEDASNALKEMLCMLTNLKPQYLQGGFAICRVHTCSTGCPVAPPPVCALGAFHKEKIAVSFRLNTLVSIIIF